MLKPYFCFFYSILKYTLRRIKLLLTPFFRLEEVKYNIDPLVELVASLRTKEMLYRKAFIRRCHNLHKSELEVLKYNHVPHIMCSCW